VLLTVRGAGTSLFSVKTTWILTLISVKLLKFALLGAIRYMVSSLLVKSPLLYKYGFSLIKQDCFTMDNKDFYYTEKHTSAIAFISPIDMSH
jgi:hypothetical protein